MTNQKFNLVVATAAALIAQLFVPMLSGPASAAQFGEAYVRLDRMKANTATGGTICARPTTTGAEANVVITFPSTYTVNATAANWTTSISNLPTGTSAWPGIGTATSATTPANVVTFPSGDLPDGTVGTITYCFNFVGLNTLTTAAVAANNQQANIETQTSGAAQIDKTNIALSNITNDQIVVTAVVPPTFVFTLSGNTDGFTGNLDPSTVMSTSGRTTTVTTNAKGGWIGWVKDLNQGLRSATANYTIATAGTVNAAPSTLVAGTEGFVLDADLTTDAAGGCTLVIDPEYNGTSTVMGGTFSNNYQPYAACTGAAPATSNGDVVTLIERVAISGATPAGSDYTDTITVVAAGNF